MSNTLRYLLLAAAIITAIWILRKIRKLKVKMEDAIFWIIFAIFLAILGIFPELTYWATTKMGLMSPANLIFLVIIFLLIEKVFTLSLIVSLLEEKVTTLSAELALRTHASGTDKLNPSQRSEINAVEGKTEKEYDSGMGEEVICEENSTKDNNSEVKNS